MKNFIKSIANGVIIFLLIYLIGAFICADFNISHWTIQQRGLTALVGGTMGIIVAGLSLDIYSNRTN